MPALTARAQFALMAQYNQWMNEKMYAAAAHLPAEQQSAERGAFFGSLIGTLHHIVIGDTLWLKRFTAHSAPFPTLDPVRALPTPTALRSAHIPPLDELTGQRQLLDGVILAWVDELTDADLDEVVHYATMAGVPGAKSLGRLLLHFFNHQTHHRGQASTLLFQAGVDVGPTDLLLLIPNDED
ncbi:MAG: DinB family protein [Gammaproteobacteria bacterium]